MMIIILLEILERQKGNLIVLLRMKRIIHVSLSVKQLRLVLTKVKMVQSEMSLLN